MAGSASDWISLSEAQRILGAIDKAVANVGSILTPPQRQALADAVENLKARMKLDDPDLLYNAMTAANDAAAPLTQAQMDDVLAKTAKGRKLDEF